MASLTLLTLHTTIAEQERTIKRLEEEISDLRADLEEKNADIPDSPRTQLKFTKAIIAKQEETIRALTRTLAHREALEARTLGEISERVELLCQRCIPDLEAGSVGSTSSSEEEIPR